MGADLSQGDDFCAFTFLFPLKNDCFGVKVRSYISSVTVNKLPVAMRIKYEEFINEGSLIVLDCTVLDMMEVYEDLEEFIDENAYDIRCLGYDPYNAAEFMVNPVQPTQRQLRKVIQSDARPAVYAGSALLHPEADSTAHTVSLPTERRSSTIAY
jgi:phage terminase large subunit-like protein